MVRFAGIGAGLLSIAGFVGGGWAADLPARATTKAPAIVAPAYNWTGFYIGIEGGGGWGRSQHYQNDPVASFAGLAAGRTALLGLAQTGGIDPNGALVGGTVGYSHQFSNNIVVGIENDLSWTNIQGSANLIPPFNTTETSQTGHTWLDTVRGRIGYAWNRLLVFGTGGAAFTDEGVQLCNAAIAGCVGQSKTVTGWTAGAGAEHAFAGHWSAKLEYVHVDFGSQFYSRTPTPVGGFFVARNVTLTDDIVRAGVNYKFGWGGPVHPRD